MNSTRLADSDSQLWSALHTAETAYYHARMRFVQGVSHPTRVLESALQTPYQRGAALRFLMISDDESMRRELFPVLLDLATVSHSDIDLVRNLIQSIDRRWVNSQLERHIPALLETAGSEEYRRLAELLRRLNSPVLSSVVSLASQHTDEEIREVAEDFEGRMKILRFNNAARRYVRTRQPRASQSASGRL